MGYYMSARMTLKYYGPQIWNKYIADALVGTNHIDIFDFCYCIDGDVSATILMEHNALKK